ncbi:hypothetical protein Smp_083580 [Schistosoma mansoni]|uniref:hypothetical protein n=1 Tax=Schistosoma mansoni TaxID=6183 RepID=UPI00022DCAA5|nr:hypothetical protein Smp_083580 [Schistosoma mansoni]|eukprot:XP_018654109.1 hypothetical protein Smp_083580 [Schistosoma mansoni]
MGGLNGVSFDSGLRGLSAEPSFSCSSDTVTVSCALGKILSCSEPANLPILHFPSDIKGIEPPTWRSSGTAILAPLLKNLSKTVSISCCWKASICCCRCSKIISACSKEIVIFFC